MAIVTALERAKQYLILPAGDFATQTNNAEIPATQEFQREFVRYLKLKYMDDSFNSSAVDKIDDYFIWVTLELKQIKRMYKGFLLKVNNGNYAGEYQVLDIDRTNYKIKIEADYYDETITFENAELQLYNDALGWYICSFCTFTLQDIKACKILIRSSQNGKAETEQYSQMTINQFRNWLKNNGKRLLSTKYYPVIF